MKTLNIVDEYINYVNLYKDQYKKYLVLLMVGSFYEIYSIIPDDPKLKEISELLNLVLTRKNKNINEISQSNPLMMGFPSCSLNKYLDILTNNNYTVIEYIQYLDKTKVKRKLNRIYSISTYLENEKSIINDNLMLSLYIEQIDNNILYGISIINLSTGTINIFEKYNKDLNKILEEINKILIIYQPKEILISYNKITNNINKIIQIINNNNDNTHILTHFEEDIKKIAYQNNFLENIYNKYNFGNLTPIESLDLERNQYSLISLIILLKFAYSHDNSIINNIEKPIINIDTNKLNLHNNALFQLNIFAYNSNYKINSLFDIINKTSTSLGKRFLKENLSEPILDINELNNRYNLIEKLQNNNEYINYEKELNNIIDIEKYHKNMGINKLQPFQLYRLDQSYKAIVNIINYAKTDFKHIFDFDTILQFNDFYNYMLKIFNFNNLETINFNNSNVIINKNIFNDNINSDIDNIMQNINNHHEYLNNIIQELSALINNDKIEIKYTDREGYYLCLTKIRAKKLQTIILNNNSKYYSDLIFENKTQSNCYITSPKIKDISIKIVKLQNKLFELTKNTYFNSLTDIYNKYYHVLIAINKFIAYIDLIKCLTKISIIYNYSKPIIINDSNKSFINVKNIRHPIIEQLKDDTEYVTNDIEINTDTVGTLLYSVNGTGKSSLMKAIGLNIILAQIGSYTASSYFEYYPYNQIFTRIDHSDNLFKGLSSFESEILELKTILNYSNEFSLILGDEILNSTENISAISLISSSINHFLNNNISFIFASHLHQIPDFINETLKNKLFIGHLTAEYDNVNQCFIYSRKLLPGLSSQNYGLIVAKSVLNNDSIINDALNIQNKILDNNNDFLKPKKSKYNSKLYINSCYICDDLNIKKKETEILDTHHIVQQKDFNENICTIYNKKHVKKNNKSNLVILCKFHHIEVHKNNIHIDKWSETTRGPKLLYTINN
jgi:DNA mismatch repair protein MutS